VIFQRADWMSSAACKGMDPNLFHPRRGNVIPKEAVDACNRCPVVAPCRAMAIADQTIFGYWGGTTGRQRKTIRSNRRQFRTLREEMG